MAHANPTHEPTVHRLPSMVRTRVTAPRGGAAGMIERVSFLTPYAAEEIAQEARRAGRGAQLDVSVPASTSDAGVAAVDSLFAWLREKGVSVVIRRGDFEG
jgi:hypothetical protein